MKINVLKFVIILTFASLITVGSCKKEGGISLPPIQNEVNPLLMDSLTNYLSFVLGVQKEDIKYHQEKRNFKVLDKHEIPLDTAKFYFSKARIYKLMLENETK